MLPDTGSTTPDQGDPWKEVWDELDSSIKNTFGRALNDEDVKKAKSTPGGWEGDFFIYYHHNYYHFLIIIIITMMMINTSHFLVLYIDANNLYGTVQTQR